MPLKLALNTGFLVNRYAVSDDWGHLFKNVFKVKYIQYTADLLNPSLPNKIFYKETDKLKNTLKKFDLNIHSTFTGAFTRLNHLSHPDEDIQKYWITWFKKFIDFTVEVGAKSMGSHLGIFTYKENSIKKLREKRLKVLFKNWHIVGNYALAKGLDFLAWEPMSINRELGETITNCREIQLKINENSPIPFKLCYDVDHGQANSGNDDDTDPSAWIDEFKNQIGYIHLKQSIKNKHGHWPFTNEYNKEGKIIPEIIISKLKSNNLDNLMLILELSFKEREPFDSLMIKQVEESVKFWKNFL